MSLEPFQSDSLIAEVQLNFVGRGVVDDVCLVVGDPYLKRLDLPFDLSVQRGTALRLLAPTSCREIVIHS